MGIIGAIKSGASAVKSGASSLKSSVTGAYNTVKTKYDNSKGLFGTNYRTGVLNDFSIVTKAVFYLLDYEDGKYKKFAKALPVQINPDHLYHAAAKKTNHQSCISGGNEKSRYGYDNSSQNDSLDIRVVYDIYDDYVAGGEFIGKDISLFNRDYTSLPELIEIATEPNNNSLRVLFKWGEIQHFGMLTNASVDYTAFSRWGSPLKAEATFSMTLVDMTEHMDLGTLMEQVNAYTSLSDTLNKTTLAGLKGAQEMGGIALGVVQSLRG